MNDIIEELFQKNITIYISIVIPVILTITMLFLRKNATSKPISTKTIILPTIFMSTGSFMYVFDIFRISKMLILELLIIGIICSIILIAFSRFEVKNNQIYLIPTKLIYFILITFFIIRILIKLFVGNTLSIGESAGMFYFLAFSTLFTWRLGMLIKFKKLTKKIESNSK